MQYNRNWCQKPCKTCPLSLIRLQGRCAVNVEIEVEFYCELDYTIFKQLQSIAARKENRIMCSSLAEEGRYVTYEEFSAFNQQDEVKREYFDGIVIALASPSGWHQQVVRRINSAFDTYFKGKKCTPWDSRDVKLYLENNRYRLYVPDVFVLCDATKDDGQTIHGAPDLVVEVWSPSNGGDERKRKIADYKDAGVREIWEITADMCVRHVKNAPDDYTIAVFYKGESVASRIFPGLSVTLEDM